jgi:hypothetical protein
MPVNGVLKRYQKVRDWDDLLAQVDITKLDEVDMRQLARELKRRPGLFRTIAEQLKSEGKIRRE